MAARRRQARVLTVYGGVGYETQLDQLTSGVEVVVGTPGRLLDLADRRILDLSHIKVLVLDEADEMLDLGFLPDVERILAKTPELRQTMLFSATMPSAIVNLARRHLRHPVNIRAESGHETTTVPTTAQFVYQAHDLDKPEVVARILQAENRDRVMIFCRTKRAAQRVADDLAERGFAATAIHGDLNQIAREKALERFRSGTIDVLVATDVAARGIDVEGVTHVINYECPDDDKTYVHRIGRTGRAGASGIAITFVDWADRTRWKVINNVSRAALRGAAGDLLDLGRICSTTSASTQPPQGRIVDAEAGNATRPERDQASASGQPTIRRSIRQPAPRSAEPATTPQRRPGGALERASRRLVGRGRGRCSAAAPKSRLRVASGAAPDPVPRKRSSTED